MLAGILSLVSLVALWLSDCIPGLGVGSKGEGEAEAEAEAEHEKAQPAEPEPETDTRVEPETAPPAKAAPDRAPRQLRVIVDARGCIIGDAEPRECASSCEDEALFEGVEEVLIDAKEGPHDKTIAVIDCAKQRELPQAIERD